MTLASLALIMGNIVGAQVPGAAKDSRWKAAGCFIPTSDGVVLTIDSRTVRIQLPMGRRQPEESAKQTAARETWEETGIDVIVETLVTTFQESTVLLFLCIPAQPLQDYSRLKSGDGDEVAEIIVVDPLTMMSHDGRHITARWRFVGDREIVIALYDKWKNP